MADVFLPSWSEVHQLWPGMGPLAALRHLIAGGCRCAVIKMGAGGSVASDGSQMVLMPPLPVRVVDTTGAGNAFCGAFHVTWRESSDLVHALSSGAAAASVVIEGFGGLHALTEGSLERVAERSQIGLETHRPLR